MISIVISSVKKQLLKDIEKNIEKTIGIPFEIISFENSSGKRGICEIYNKGAQLAKFDYICFMHEDIELKTQDWGQRVLETFHSNKNLGLLGIAGSSYKSSAPSGWETFPDIGINYINIIQSYKDKTLPAKLFCSNSKNEKLDFVSSVDGVWFCTKKEIALQFPFDEKLLQGFHCYDIDFSLSISQKFKIAITYEILIEHFSEGNCDRTWLIETLKLHKKWRNYLPVNIANLDKNQRKSIEYETLQQVIDKMTKFQFTMKDKFNVLYSIKNIDTIGIKNFLKLHYYIILKAY